MAGVTILEAKLLTAASVAWDDGEPFDGFVLMFISLPLTYQKAYLEGTGGYEIPTRVKVPIHAGVLSDEVRLHRTSTIFPPNTRWTDLWYDASGRQVATGSLHDIDVAEYTLTPPTLSGLTAPSSVDSSPFLDNLLTTVTYPLHEELVGTKNGSNKTFSVSQTPLAWLALWRGGFKLVEGADYTRSGTTVTFTAASPAPESNETLEAAYWVE